MKHNRYRWPAIIVVVFSAWALLATVSSGPVAVQAQQDPTIMARQAELAATKQVEVASARATESARMATRFALEVTATEDARQMARTATAEAKVTQAARATSDWIAGSTATAEAKATQAAIYSAWTMTTTATADVMAFEARMTREARENERRLSAAQGTMKVIGVAILLFFGAGLVFVSLYRLFHYAQARVVAEMVRVKAQSLPKPAPASCDTRAVDAQYSIDGGDDARPFSEDTADLNVLVMVGEGADESAERLRKHLENSNAGELGSDSIE